MVSVPAGLMRQGDARTPPQAPGRDGRKRHRWPRLSPPSRGIFVWLSLALVAIVALVLAANRDAAERVLDEELGQRSGHVRDAYALALSGAFSELQMLAELQAGDPTVLALMQQARGAIGSAGDGAEAAQLRQELQRRVSVVWLRSSQDFGVRRLGYFLGTAAAAFLNVEHPAPTGDHSQGGRFATA